MYLIIAHLPVCIHDNSTVAIVLIYDVGEVLVYDPVDSNNVNCYK